MIGRIYNWLCALVSAAGLVVVLGAGCQRQGARAPEGDDLAELAQLVDEGRAVAPLAHGVCDALGVEEAQRCHGTVDALDELLEVGGALASAAQACREQGDQECVANALETARDLAPKVRRLLPLARLLAAGVR